MRPDLAPVAGTSAPSPASRRERSRAAPQPPRPPRLAPPPTTPRAAANYGYSLGTGHALRLEFRKTASGTYDVRGVTDASDVSSPAPGADAELGAGVIRFDGGGMLLGDPVIVLTADFAGAASDQHIAVDFGTEDADGIFHPQTWEFQAPEAVFDVANDGRNAGPYHFGLVCE
jgi:hypothetical protein